MFLSYNWLQDLVKLPQSATPEKLGDDLTMHTVEIDGVEPQAQKFRNVVMGQVLAVEPHPNADRLQLSQVDTGDKEVRRIVCGASNLKQGQTVAVALPGAVLADGTEIKETQVRGEASQGMICAEDELGLGEGHDGIMVFEEKKAKPGQALAEYLELDDILFEVDNKSITNRPDLWGHAGIAREIACFLNTKNTKLFKQIVEAELAKSETGDIEVKVDNFDLCPRYMALKVDNIKVEESPKWMQERLSAVGIRPINNIVDVTNYVMLELGQPMHAFDGEKVKKIVVRETKAGEAITTLDGEKRDLEEGILAITDGENPIAIAGVMGGENSEINEDTTSIILESANFESTLIRKTSQKLGLRTESSMRFEKSLDPCLAELGLARAKQLLEKICSGARISGEAVDIYDTEKENFGFSKGPIELGLEWLSRMIGQEIEEEKIIEILKSLGFEVDRGSEGNLSVSVPSWRATKDISIKEDLVEEVARIYGYENIEPQPAAVDLEKPLSNKNRELERRVKNILSEGATMTEVYNYSFVGEDKLKKIGLDPTDYIRLANPFSSQHALLRQNLVPNLLENIRLNQPNYSRISIFEVGEIYLNIDGEVSKDPQSGETLPYQEKRLALMEAGDGKDDVFFRIKGKVEHLLAHFDLEVEYAPGETPSAWVRDDVFAHITVQGKIIGVVGQVDKKVLKNLGIKKEVAAAEINWPQFYEVTAAQPEKQYQSQPRYPALVRDLAFVVDAKILYNDIKEEIENFQELIEKVELFDVYQGEKLGKNKKSLAFHVSYRSLEKTLTSEEAEQVQTDLIKRLEDKFQAQIRDF